MPEAVRVGILVFSDRSNVLLWHLCSFSRFMAQQAGLFSNILLLQAKPLYSDICDGIVVRLEYSACIWLNCVETWIIDVLQRFKMRNSYIK